MIVIQVALSIAVFLEKNKLPLLPAMATLVIALFGIGRGSIVVAFLIIVISFFVNYFASSSLVEKNESTRRFFGFVMLVLMVVGIAYAGYFGFVNSLIEQSKFSAGLLDSHRGAMLSDYLSKMEGWSLIFGADYTGTSIESTYGGNPHNSYIRLHSYYGLFGLLFIIFSPFSLFVSNKAFIYKSVIFLLVSLVLTRAATDPLLFPTLLDFFYVLYFFLFWKYAPRKD
ncbi:hypothetical protein DT594_17620 [Halopseudomonas laoshanensis]|uniref:O-antigen polymerase n=1 Tax=Halopseudomonas laoshanensis TaxID=2268758 RepID=A0A7V7KU72_9GAMM|nr:hypothetical protein DT594_17620 [Halopseudomonas laoshanensis]